MTSLIDRDALIAEYDRIHVGKPGGARKLMVEAPEVDAVSVVRCKDCGWYEVARYTKEGLPDKRCKPSLCSMWVCCTEPDFYCAYGERGKSFFKIDAVPVRHGKFIGTEYDGYADGNPVYYEWQCSECGCVFEDEEPTYNYCPNCGARMDGESDE